MEETSEVKEEKNEIKTEPTHHNDTHHSSKKYNVWMVVSIILAVAVIVLLFFMLRGGVTGNAIKGEDAGKKLVDFLNLRTGGGVEYISYEDKGDIYAVSVSYQGQNIPVYITKDGEYFVQAPVSLSNETTTAKPECTTDDDCQSGETCQSGYCVAPPKEVPKSDKPKVELFVMTYCPYGTQAEKGVIPAIKALGTKVDAKIRFVHYFMHGDKEEQETYTQVCIREEQNAKFLPYLECFLEDGDSARCLTKAGIDKTKLNTCLADGNKTAKVYYEKDKTLSNGYGVQGSPTLIINGVETDQFGRDRSSSNALKIICSAFNTSPKTECSKTLSTASPSSGFGTAASTSGSTPSSGSAGSCG
jgi:Cys-rich repeat protein